MIYCSNTCCSWTVPTHSRAGQLCARVQEQLTQVMEQQSPVSPTPAHRAGNTTSSCHGDSLFIDFLLLGLQKMVLSRTSLGARQDSCTTSHKVPRNRKTVAARHIEGGGKHPQPPPEPQPFSLQAEAIEPGALQGPLGASHVLPASRGDFTPSVWKNAAQRSSEQAYCHRGCIQLHLKHELRET